MSELAFNANGESFEIPATVTGWRVRRMKPRGAPELVYGKDGRPLMIGIEADIDELREAVGSTGKYRLDPINDDGKCVENVPAAYVQVVKPQRNGIETGIALAAPAPSDDTLREAMRLNTELARSVIDRFPEMMTAAAELLRAADGAGIPRREPRDSVDFEDDEDTTPATGSPSFEFLNNLIAQVVPVLVMKLANGKLDLASALDWRKASPDSKKLAAKATVRPEGPGDTGPKQEPVAAPPITTELPPIEPQMMAHFIAIQSALKPDEAALARQVASELAPAELRAWIDDLGKLSVPQAVQKIRVLIAGNTEAVS